jgi:membrane associated rhomboid family serine protease
MRAAAVGHQCVDCVRAGAATVRAPRTIFGGRERASGTPVVSYTLIAVNIVMYMAQSASASLERALVLWPPGVAMDGEIWRIFTSAFLHYGPAHLLFNMLALWIIGPPLERWLGRSRFVALYILSALGGGVLVYLLAPLNSATAGASGAIFGLFGATFVVGKRLDLDVRGVIALIAINLAFTFVVPAVSSQQISWQGHVGGLLTGALVAWIYAYAPRERGTTVHVGVSVTLLALFVVLVVWRTSTLQALFA